MNNVRPMAPGMHHLASQPSFSPGNPIPGQHNPHAQQPPMGLLQNNQPGPPMSGLLAGNTPNPSAASMYPLAMQSSQQHVQQPGQQLSQQQQQQQQQQQANFQRHRLMAQAHFNPSMVQNNSGANLGGVGVGVPSPGQAHLNGLQHTSLGSVGGVGLGNSPVSVRRVPSQPQVGASGGVGLGGMHVGSQGAAGNPLGMLGGGVASMANVPQGMRPGGPLTPAAQMQRMQQQHHQQQHQHHQQQQHLHSQAQNFSQQQQLQQQLGQAQQSGQQQHQLGNLQSNMFFALQQQRTGNPMNPMNSLNPAVNAKTPTLPNTLQRTPSAQSLGSLGPPALAQAHTPSQPSGSMQPPPPPFQSPLNHPHPPPTHTMPHSGTRGMPGGGHLQGSPMPGNVGMGSVVGLGQMHQNVAHSNAGSPPRPGSISQPQTPALPMTGNPGVANSINRPQSRSENNNLLYNMQNQNAQFGGVGLGIGNVGSRMPGSGQPGTPGAPPFPYAMGQSGGRTTPQHQQNQIPMAGLGNSPGGPGTGAAGNPALANMSSMGNLGAAMGRPGSNGGLTAPGVFSTPAQVLQTQSQRPEGSFGGVMPHLASGIGGPAPLTATHRRSPSLNHSQQMGGNSLQQINQQAQQGAAGRIGTPQISHSTIPHLSGPQMHSNYQQQLHAQQAHSQTLNRPPSQPVHSQPQAQQAGPSRTPRSQHAALPTTSGGSQTAPPMSALAMNNSPLMTSATKPTGPHGVPQPPAGPAANHPSPGIQSSPATAARPPSRIQQQQQQYQQQHRQSPSQQHSQQQPQTHNARPPSRAQPQMPNNQQQPIARQPPDTSQQFPNQQNPPLVAPMTALTPASAGPQPSGQAQGSEGVANPVPPLTPGFIPGVPRVVVQTSQALMRMLQFSETLSNSTSKRRTKEDWAKVVEEFFIPKAVVKITLWKDNQLAEAKPFDISVPILPQFFLVTCQSGVTSMSISLDGARERIAQGFQQPGFLIECSDAVWTYRYENGYIVTLRGVLFAHLVMQPLPAAGLPSVLRFETLTFDAKIHEKAIRLDAIVRSVDPTKSPPKDDGKIILDRAIPAEPVNAFGIPQATMRCLELAESVSAMSDLIEFSIKTKAGPIDALKKYAQIVKERQPQNNTMEVNQTNGVATSPSVTLYRSSPPHAGSGPTPNPQQLRHAQGHGDSSSPLLASTPASAQTPTAPPLSAGPSSSSNSTPLISNATLKRKAQGSDLSPTTTSASDSTNVKRNRKRGRTGGG